MGCDSQRKHNIEIDEKVRGIRKEISRLLEELRSFPGRVRIEFPHHLKAHIISSIVNSPNDDTTDDVPYLLEILHEGTFFYVDPVVVYGYKHRELNKLVTIDDLTHLTAAPGLLINWRIPFDKSIRTQELERRRKIGKEIAVLKKEIKALHSNRLQVSV